MSPELDGTVGLLDTLFLLYCEPKLDFIADEKDMEYLLSV